jgi:hypothetical protein
MAMPSLLMTVEHGDMAMPLLSMTVDSIDNITFCLSWVLALGFAKNFLFFFHFFFFFSLSLRKEKGKTRRKCGKSVENFIARRYFAKNDGGRHSPFVFSDGWLLLCLEFSTLHPKAVRHRSGIIQPFDWVYRYESMALARELVGGGTLHVEIERLGFTRRVFPINTCLLLPGQSV